MAKFIDFITNYIMLLVGIMMGISLIPVVNSSIAQSNIPGVTGALLNILPLIIVVFLVLSTKYLYE